MRLVELHPVLELALRRQAQSPVFHAVRAGLAAATGALFLAVVAQRGLVPGEELPELAVMLREAASLPVCLYVLFVVPALTVGPYVRARETGMLEALVLSGVPEWQIVRAFWWSSMAGCAVCLAGSLPFFAIVTGLPGMRGAEVALILFGAGCSAGLLAAIVLAFGATSNAGTSVGQAALTFSLGASLLALVVAIFLRLVLPGWLTAGPRVVGQDYVAFAVGLGALVAMAGTLSHAGRRLAKAVSSDDGRTPYSLAVRLNPEAFRFRSDIDDAPGHLLGRLSRGPDAAALAGSAAALTAAAFGGEAHARIALLALAAVALLAGAWSATRGAELFASRDKASDLSLAGHDPARLRGRVQRGALAASRSPIAAFVTLGALGLVRGWLPAREAVLLAALGTASWLLATAGAMHLVILQRRGNVALILVVAALIGGALWVDVLSGPEPLLALAHPLALMASLVRHGFQAGTAGGPTLLAAFLWLVASLSLDAQAAERWRRLYREPAA